MGEGLFNECAIAFVPSNSLTPKTISEVRTASDICDRIFFG